MASLNHGKIVNALENIVKGPREEFIWDSHRQLPSNG